MNVARKQKLNITAGKSVSAEKVDRIITGQTSNKKKKTLSTLDNGIGLLRSLTPRDESFSSIEISKKDIVDDDMTGVNGTKLVNAIPHRKIKKGVSDAVSTKKSPKITFLKDVKFSKENTVFSMSNNEPLEEIFEILDGKSSDHHSDTNVNSMRIKKKYSAHKNG